LRNEGGYRTQERREYQTKRRRFEETTIILEALAREEMDGEGSLDSPLKPMGLTNERLSSKYRRID